MTLLPIDGTQRQLVPTFYQRSSGFLGCTFPIRRTNEAAETSLRFFGEFTFQKRSCKTHMNGWRKKSDLIRPLTQISSITSSAFRGLVPTFRGSHVTTGDFPDLWNYGIQFHNDDLEGLELE